MPNKLQYHDAKRINKSMNNGDNISTARQVDKNKCNAVKSKYVSQGGTLSGLGASEVTPVTRTRVDKKAVAIEKGQAIVQQVLDPTGSSLFSMHMKNPVVIGAAEVGTAKVEKMLSNDATVSMSALLGNKLSLR